MHIFNGPRYFSFFRKYILMGLGSGGAVPIPNFFPNPIPIPSGRDQNPDFSRRDGIGTGIPVKNGIGTTNPEEIL